MPRIVWKDAALADMARIHDRIAIDSAVNASRMVERIISKVDVLSRYPYVGRMGRLPNTWELIAHPHYVVIYRFQGRDVDILRVKHTAMRHP